MSLQIPLLPATEERHPGGEVGCAIQECCPTCQLRSPMYVITLSQTPNIEHILSILLIKLCCPACQLRCPMYVSCTFLTFPENSTSHHRYIPRTKLILGNRAFSVPASDIWSELPATEFFFESLSSFSKISKRIFSKLLFHFKELAAPQTDNDSRTFPALENY